MSAPTKDETRGWESVALLGGLALFAVAVVYAYNLGYADARRADRPLLAPPTTQERAR